MTSDQDTKVVAEPQVQQVQEVKDGSHLVSIVITHSHHVSFLWSFFGILITILFGESPCQTGPREVCVWEMFLSLFTHSLVNFCSVTLCY
uniref:Uncharacterized protein n=1 Tax=Anas platyrhynchos platyrhynchos TaxID=8840 RepID=A0A493TK79_ANAPP